MNKKLLAGLSLTLALSCLIGLAACGDEEHTEHSYGTDNRCTVCGDEWQYTKGLKYSLIPETDTYELTGIGEISLEKITVPYYYENKLVTSIGDYAFEWRSEITDITLPESITNIGIRTFNDCSELENINIPKKLESIGSAAFSGCRKLTSIRIPESVTYIGWNAFSGCPQLIETKNGVQYVDRWAIACDENATSVTLTDAVGIANMSFCDCTEMTSITIPKRVKSIGSQAFLRCEKLNDITYDGTVSEWQSIRKENNWDEESGNYTVHCTNGNLDKNGNAIS